MHASATDRENVLAVMRAALQRLETAPPAATFKAAAEAAEPGERITRERLAELLRQGLEYAATEEPRLAARGEEDLEPDGEYVSRHTVIALVQSAIDEAADRGAAVTLEGIAANVALKDARNAPFIRHQSLDDFRFPLPDECRVVLVSDWGTGSRGAKKVAQVIRKFEPHHVIHLGDIYASGKPNEVRKHFIDVWNEHGPSEAKFWAMNGNHEMKSGGKGYFELVLPFCGQPASYFSLQNAHWKLIGLDTAYFEDGGDDHDLFAPQIPWLDARLREGDSRNILLTHHQPFSAYDERPTEPDHRLAATMKPFVDSGRVFGWFWGHEHACVIYEDDQFRARAIGHGGKDTLASYYAFTRHPSPKVRHTFAERVRKGPSTAPAASRVAMNGCALLNFQGPVLEIEYADEEGKRWFQETW